MEKESEMEWERGGKDGRESKRVTLNNARTTGLMDYPKTC